MSSLTPDRTTSEELRCDWASCLVLVAAYDDVGDLVAQAAARVDRALLLSPELADFIELRYVALGPRPGTTGARARAVEKLVDNAARPLSGASVQHLAAVIVDEDPDASLALAEEVRATFGGVGIDITVVSAGTRNAEGPGASSTAARRDPVAAMLLRTCKALLASCAGADRPDVSIDALRSLAGARSRLHWATSAE